MQKYRGVNTSLYPSLDGHLIPYLERAVILTEHGSYEKAEAILERDLFSQRFLPVVVLARAEWALKQFKIGVLHRILNEALSNPSINLETPEYRLLVLMRAFAALCYKGDIMPAINELERAKAWLQNIDIAEYTDIQVRTIKIIVGENSKLIGILDKFYKKICHFSCICILII